MKVINTCQECSGELRTSSKVHANGDIEVMTELCPRCVARAVQLAKENGWMCDFLLKRGKITK